jgi:hypothetical protein
VKQTSIEAYYEANAKGILSQRRFEVIKALFYLVEPSTCREVYEWLIRNDWAGPSAPPKDSVNPRFAELVYNGMVKEYSVRPCKFTTVEGTTWMLTGHIPYDWKFPDPLPCCEMCGQVMRTGKSRVTHNEHKEEWGWND